jgi:hypothetical protein
MYNSRDAFERDEGFGGNFSRPDKLVRRKPIPKLELILDQITCRPDLDQRASQNPTQRLSYGNRVSKYEHSLRLIYHQLISFKEVSVHGGD